MRGALDYMICTCKCKMRGVLDYDGYVRLHDMYTTCIYKMRVY